MAKKRKAPSPKTIPGLTVIDRRVMIRVVLISSVLLGISLLIMHTLLAGLVVDSPGWLRGVRTALGLLLFWLFVTAAVRTLLQLLPKLRLVWAVLVGVATAALGQLIFLLSLRLLALVWDSPATLPSYRIIGFYSLGGVFASLIALVRLRIEDRRLGLFLEVLLVAMGMGLFIWLGF